MSQQSKHALSKLLEDPEPSGLFFVPKLKQHASIAVATLLGIIFIGLSGLFYLRYKQEDKAKIEIVDVGEDGLEDISDGSDLIIDLSGAVVKPGVYKITSGKRLNDLLELAGGFDEDVDRMWVQKELNLAAKLKDAQKIYIPFNGEMTRESDETNYQVLADQDMALVNLNVADSSQLESLPGIGPSMAAKILELREQQGSFGSVEDLLSISGFGEKTLDKIRDSVVVE